MRTIESSDAISGFEPIVNRHLHESIGDEGAENEGNDTLAPRSLDILVDGLQPRGRAQQCHQSVEGRVAEKQAFVVGVEQDCRKNGNHTNKLIRATHHLRNHIPAQEQRCQHISWSNASSSTENAGEHAGETDFEYFPLALEFDIILRKLVPILLLEFIDRREPIGLDPCQQEHETRIRKLYACFELASGQGVVEVGVGNEQAQIGQHEQYPLADQVVALLIRNPVQFLLSSCINFNGRR